jgi:hypothetical protein
MLRPLLRYPFSSVLDNVVSVHGSEHIQIKQEQSLIFNLDVDHVDTSIRSYIEQNFSPSQMSSLSDSELKSEDVFELLSPLSSRFCTDRAMRLQFAEQLQQYLDQKSETLKKDKETQELKAKYDEFIKTLSSDSK